MENGKLDPRSALERLKAGNERYLSAVRCQGDISPSIRQRTFTEGQHPYAIVVACSDSRVIPEAIFDAGIGELFVIRTAGNTIGDSELGSLEYAISHLGCKLVLVLGHDNCGAVGAALDVTHAPVPLFTKRITDKIKEAIGMETDPYKASLLNVRHSAEMIREKLGGGLAEDAICGTPTGDESGRATDGFGVSTASEDSEVCAVFRGFEVRTAIYHLADGRVEFDI